jgi:hypothetical protein
VLDAGAMHSLRAPIRARETRARVPAGREDE